MSSFKNLGFLLLLMIELLQGQRMDEQYSYADGIQEPFVNYYPDGAVEYIPKSNYAVYPDPDSGADMPIILWWTKSLYPHGFYASGLAHLSCDMVHCLTTSDRKFLKDKRTRGVMFYGTDIEPENLPLPRAKHHEWALFHEESPLNNYMLHHSVFIKLFNHTATFRRESDYPITTQAIYSKEYLLNKPVPLEEKNKAQGEEGLAPVLYVQSHCEVPSDRDRYIEELMKHIDIDSYGTCLHNKDLPEHLRDPASNYENEEFLHLISSYKFHLAFENGICKDYMTEKLMRPLHVGAVPVYRGSPDAQDWMPNNHTIILADDFASPKELAEYIKFLNENDEEYLKYMEYKDEGITNEFLSQHLEDRPWAVNEPQQMDYFRGFECHLCKQLNERIAVEKAHEEDPSIPLLPPKMANNSHMGCPPPYTALGNPEDLPAGDKWKKMDWPEMHWSGLDQARAINRMLESGEKDSKKFNKYLRR